MDWGCSTGDGRKYLMFLATQRLHLIQRRTVWCPTWLGSFCVAIILGAPIAWWLICGESFLSLTKRLPPEVLVVEGWIGHDAVHAAADEFRQGGYQYVVAAGGWTSAERWEEGGWSYAEMAERELIRSGVPKDKIILGSARNVETQRTYESAIAVWRALRAKGIQPKTLNVFTSGAHARRSDLVFAKVYEPGTKIGVISWATADSLATPWWRSSERSRELLTETAGYLFEAFFNSGRHSNAPG
jgi:uncharacterized SAM-binding protein YcdF (DUF218 family)